VLMLVLVGVDGLSVEVSPLSEFYVPASINGPAEIAAGAGEQFDFDKDAKVAYVVGETGFVNILSYADYANPELLETVDIGGTGTDIEVCGGLVAIAMEGLPTKQDDGKIKFYKAYISGEGIVEQYEVTTMPLPDMIHFSDDCTIMVVANEGEAAVQNATLVNPPGGVTVLKWDGDLMQAPTQVNLTFDEFNGNELFKPDGSGVLWSYRPDNEAEANNQSSFQQDLEPEYVAIAEDNSMAFVILQENNAVAFVSLGDTPKIEAIAPLGLKSWKDLKIDASNRDSGVNMVSGYEIYGAYQPDTIKTFSRDGKHYLITANEGDAKEYLFDNEAEDEYWIEERRGADFEVFAPSVSEEMKSMLADQAQLGRLKFLDKVGLDENGMHERFIAMGGRSVSIFEMTVDGANSKAELKWDSGDEVEAKHAELDPNGEKGLFNPEQVDPASDLPADGFDGRSDDKGVETETVELGMCGGAQLLFVGNERASSLFIYDISDFPGSDPTLLTVVPMANPLEQTNKTWQQLFEDRELGIVDPESMKYVPVGDEEGILLVAGAVSGTVSAYQLKCDGAGAIVASDSAATTPVTVFWSVLIAFLSAIWQ